MLLLVVVITVVVCFIIRKDWSISNDRSPDEEKKKFIEKH